MTQAQRTIRVLYVQAGSDAGPDPVEWLGNAVDVVSVESLELAQDALAENEFDFVVATPEWVRDVAGADSRGADGDSMVPLSQAVGIVDRQGAFIWANPKLLGYSDEVRRQVAETCTESFDWLTESASQTSSHSFRGHRFTFRTEDKSLYELSVTPMLDLNHQVSQVVAIVHDIGHDHAVRARLEAAERAGLDLLHLNPKQFSHLGAQERLALLEQRILRCARDILEFDGFAVCILDPQTKKLDLVLSVAMPEAARGHDLCAEPEGHGIAGYVAYHGRSFICADVTQDARYLKGIPGACSSLTVPLKLGGETVGILDFESREEAAFDDDSRRYAEEFGRYVATALHILELLMAERHVTFGQIGKEVVSQTDGPLNEITVEIAGLREDPKTDEQARERLAKMSEAVEAVRESIKTATLQKPGLVGHRRMGLRRRDPVLAEKRILVADDEPMIREIIRDVLVSYGSKVGVAENGVQAIEMIQEQPFDLVLSDIKMPGRDGYEVFSATKDVSAGTPVILMTGFGYDPNHSIVRARRDGLSAVLFKPFKVDQLLGEVRAALQAAAEA